MKHLSVLFALLFSQVTLSQTITLRDTTNQFDYIIITVPEFKSACETFKQHKQETFGFKILIADTAMIYREFNAFSNKEDNIREFISFAGTYWQYPQPQYFLLAGDLTRIPSHLYYFIDTSYTDYFYSLNIDSKDTLNVDFFIGRIPAINTDYLTNYFSKVITYENDQNLLLWNNNALFISEYDSSRIYKFDSTVQLLSSQAADFISTKHIVMGNISLPTFGNGDSIISYLNSEGSSSVWFFGRACTQTSFGTNNYFMINDIDLIQTSGKNFISFFLSTQKFANDTIISLTDKLVLSTDAAIAGIGFTGPSFYYAGTSMLKKLVERLYSDNAMSLSERINVPTNTSEFSYYQRVIMNLWGDPSLKLKFDLPTNVDEWDLNQPIKYYLFQNYPNPFNPSTRISFSLSTPGYVQIKIFDSLGNEVSILSDEFYDEGIHSIEFNTENLSEKLSSGVYLYSIKTGDYFQTKKMLYLK